MEHAIVLSGVLNRHDIRCVFHHANDRTISGYVVAGAIRRVSNDMTGTTVLDIFTEIGESCAQGTGEAFFLFEEVQHESERSFPARNALFQPNFRH